MSEIKVGEERSKPVVLWFGDSPTAHTGFGTVTKELALRLSKKYNIIFLGINYNGDPLPESKVFNIYPCIGDPYGRDRFPNLLRAVRPDILFTLNDYDAVTWIPQALVTVRQEANKNIPWIGYFPIDGEPMYPKYIQFIKEWIDYPVTTTKWGTDVVKKADPGLEIPYIYHGVDTNMFSPLDVEQRKARRAETNISDDKFVVTMVGVNQVRKQYGTALQAFAEFAKDKEDVVLILHTQKHLQQGWEIPAIVQYLDRKYQDKGLNGIANQIAYSNGITGYLGIERERMATLYGISDAFLHTAVGEGFGLPLIEASACGLPIIAHKATVMPELLKNNALWCKTADTMFFPFADRSLERPLVNKSDVVKNLNKLYTDREFGRELGSKARKAILRGGRFNWDTIADQFDELFEESLEDKREVKLDDLQEAL